MNLLDEVLDGWERMKYKLRHRRQLKDNAVARARRAESERVAKWRRYPVGQRLLVKRDTPSLVWTYGSPPTVDVEHLQGVVQEAVVEEVSVSGEYVKLSGTWWRTREVEVLEELLPETAR